MVSKVKSWLLALLMASGLPGMAHDPENIRLKHGLFFNGREFVPKNLYVVNHRFQETAPTPIDRVIDLGGRYIIPPLGDAHNHRLAENPNLESENRLFMRAGIFYIKNPNNIGKFTRQAREVLKGAETVDVIYANGGLTGPGGHPIQIYQGFHGGGEAGRSLENQAYFVIGSEADLEQKWPVILMGEPDFIKIYLEHSELHPIRKDQRAYFGKRGLDPELVPIIVARAHAAGIDVAAHVTSTHDFHVAVAAGVDEIAHLPLAPIREADAVRAKARGIAVVTTTLSHRPAGHGVDVSQIHRDNLALLKRVGVRLVIGIDNRGTALDELLNLASMGIFENRQLLQLATVETPTSIFPNRKIGALKSGYEASFLALAKNPLESLENLKTIEMRFKQGHIIELEKTTPLPGIGDALLGVAMQKGSAGAISTYYRLKKDSPHDYRFDEAQLNNLGYQLLNHRKFEDAIAIFKLNLSLFPDSINPYDSLAEAHQVAGNTQAAIAYYQQVLKKLEKMGHMNEQVRKRYASNARAQLLKLEGATPSK